MRTEPALYVPKSLTITKNQDDFQVRVKAKNPADFLGALVLFFVALFILPLTAFILGPLALLLILGAIGFAIYLVVRSSPEMTLTPEGVIIRNTLYSIKDIAGFSDEPNDKWALVFAKYVGTGVLGLRYGIYNVTLPYLLPLVELPLVIIHLNNLLESFNQEIGEERDLKIQQAQKF